MNFDTGLTARTPFLNYFFFRAFYCLLLAWALLERTDYFLSVADLGLFQGFLVPMPFAAGKWLLFASLLFCGTGIFPRLTAGAAFAFYLNFFLRSNLVIEPWDDNLVAFTLLIFAAGPSANFREFFVRDRALVPEWPLTLVKINLCLVYFATFVTKISGAGIEWVQGDYMQAYLLQRYFLSFNPWALELARHFWLCTLISAATLILEGTFWVTLFRGPVKWMWLAAGLCMHVGVYLVMDISFLKIFLLSYLAYVPYARIFKHLE